MFTVPCIKCKTPYESEDSDPYYCPKCNEERKQIAAEIDKKVRPAEKVKSSLEIYESLPKVAGRFVHAKDFLL